MRAALYARFSSDRQNERSIDDQLRLCREKASALGATVAEEFIDRAISGATAHRPGLSAMLRAVQAGNVDVVIAEALDRISRSQRDTAGLFEDLKFAGVGIVTVAEGVIEELQIGFKGTMNALFLRDLAQKVRRGQSGVIGKGRSAGGRSYGYRVVKKIGADGEPIRGLREVDENEAAVVRRIFADVAAGKSPRAIAKALNAEGIPGPAGGRWNASTIHGNKARRNGILHNPLYIGILLWNRVRMVKNPATGRRISRVNPESEWQAFDVPELRVVDDATWNAVQATIEARAGDYPLHVHRRPKSLLSGKIKCGRCGGSMVVKMPGRLGCASFRESGTCDNNHTLNVAKVEARLLDGLQDKLLSPERIAEYVREVHAEMKRRRADAGKRHSDAQAELREVEEEIAGMIDAIKAGLYTASMKPEMLSLEERKAELQRELADAGQDGAEVVDLIPNLAETFQRRVEDLVAALAHKPTAGSEAEAAVEEAREAIRDLVDHVVAMPGDKRGEWHLALHVLPENIAALAGPKADHGGLMLSLVAEARVGHYHKTDSLVVNL